jgi:hypothetical protein
MTYIYRQQRFIEKILGKGKRINKLRERLGRTDGTMKHTHPHACIEKFIGSMKKSNSITLQVLLKHVDFNIIFQLQIQVPL